MYKIGCTDKLEDEQDGNGSREKCGNWIKQKVHGFILMRVAMAEIGTMWNEER